MSMDLKKKITEMIYKNSKDISEGVLIDFKVITPLIENIVAIAATYYRKNDNELLRNKKIKDLVNSAKSELSNYNKQKVLKTETKEWRQRMKLLKKIADLENP